MMAHLELLEAAGARARRWAMAAAFMLSAHAVAGTLAVMKWPEEEAAQEETGAFMIELAPMATSPPTEKVNLAIGPRSEESPAAVAPTEEVKEKSEIETPKVEESPLAPDPEVVVDKKKPIEEVDDKEEKEDPRPKQDSVTQVTTPPQESRAPPPVDAPPSERPAAPKQGVSSKPSEVTMSWHKSLVFHLNKHKKYPSDARKRGEEGTAGVSFTLDRSGKVINARVDRSSGSNELDKEALEVLDRASPFPPPPSEVAEPTIHLTLPIQFRIKR
jgi:protein TonB